VVILARTYGLGMEAEMQMATDGSRLRFDDYLIAPTIHDQIITLSPPPAIVQRCTIPLMTSIIIIIDKMTSSTLKKINEIARRNEKISDTS
jgi:hypothetical protein